MVSLNRVGDRSFLVDDVKAGPVQLNCKISLTSEATYFVAQKAFKQLAFHGMNKTHRFTFGGRRWKVVPVNQLSLFQRILRFFNPFSLEPAAGRFKRYRIETAWFGPNKQNNKAKSTVMAHVVAKLKIENADFLNGLRQTEVFDGTLSSFTRIATTAIRQHESHFVPPDGKSLSGLEYRIIFHKEKLLLVKKGSPLCTKSAMDEAAKIWERSVKREFGERKWNEIKDFYALNLEDGLTAEHVYRANIGVMNLEVEDLRDFAERWVLEKELTPREKRRLESWPDGWKELQDVDCDVARLSPEQFQKLYAMLAFTEEEKEQHYTGRKIFSPIDSSYTIGGMKSYKPWIDQHELIQECTRLIDCPTWEAYQEQLGHVVVKKHLLRVPPEGQARLGALIPAPPAVPGGQVRYYSVVGCISNGANLHYILQSACRDPSLPIIKLYRSTSSNPYAINAKDTVVNDLNHLNSPGYLGIKDLDKYEREFFKKCTIPVWAGYLLKAKNEESVTSLQKATVALKHSFDQSVHMMSFSEILRTHDRPLNALFFPYNSGSLRQFIQNRRRDMIGALIEKFVHVDFLQTDEEVKAAAVRLVRYLRDLQKNMDKHSTLYNQIQDLCEDLARNILHPVQKELPRDQVELLNQLNAAELAYLKANHQEQRQEKRRVWVELLEKYAIEQEETLASKIDHDINLSGHSLGGACAAIAMVRYLAKDGRIPLPGRTCTGFFFDEPGINNEDNEAFLRFGEKNYKLLNSLKVRFRIFRRHEAKDFVPTSGEMGLGAVKNKQVAAVMKKWCDYDCAVNTPLSTAEHLDVAESFGVHGTRFLSSQKDKDYAERRVTPYEEGLFRKGNHNQLSAEERKMYRNLYTRVWKISGSLERFLKERLRQSFSFPLQFVRFSLTGVKGASQHVLPKDQVDINGSFALTLDRGRKMNSQFVNPGSILKLMPKNVAAKA